MLHECMAMKRHIFQLRLPVHACSTDLYLKDSVVGRDATPPLTVLETVLDTELNISETLFPTVDPVASTLLNNVSEDPASTSFAELL